MHFFDKLRAVQGDRHFDGCKPFKMGVFRKPRFSKDDVEEAFHGFFNILFTRIKANRDDNPV
jgi:hypothetical protein